MSFFLLADERARPFRTQSKKIEWTSHISTLPAPSGNAEAHQSTNFQLQKYDATPEFGYGAGSPHEDEIAASGYVRPASAKILKPTGSETSATGYCVDVCTVAIDQQSPPSLASDPASPEASESHCACISCLKIRSCSGRVPGTRSQGNKCRFPDCLTIETGRAEICRHETSHYEGPRGYKCLEQDCRTVTSDWYELRRHYKKHCTSPNKEQFPCPVSWCKYSGTNGFLRKDKLQSHYRNIHEGKPGPFKAGRVIKPATLKPRVSSVGNGPSKQNE